jgi:hypothetical protein
MSHAARMVRAVGALFLFTSAVGCAEDSTQEPTPAGPRPPTAHDALRLWNFNLSHPDTFTLKNLGEEPLELEGIELLFDDRDDAFPPDTLLDCTVRLPAMTLAPGATLRISELPLPGEIDALAYEVSGCAYPLTYNPDRGGATYLCDGPCDESTLIDMVAHAGDDLDALEPGIVENRFREPPELRFGARFSALYGTGKYNDGLVRYQRVATEGSFPEYRSSDWGLQSRVLFADFEEGITARNVAAAPAPFDVVPGEPAEIVTSPETAASFATSLRITHLGEDGASNALRFPLDAFSTPRDLVYFARTSSPATAGSLALLSQGAAVVELGFEPETVGANGAGGRAAVTAAPDAWYRIELRDIDWTHGAFDLYVDGAPVGLGLALPENARSVDELRLYSVSAGSTAYLDAVELWGATYPANDPNDEGVPGRLRCGATDGGTGGGDPAAGPVCEDIDGPSALAATCDSYCASWNVICCHESLAENYESVAECLLDCATFTQAELCCRAWHANIGGPERCRFALGVGRYDMPPECAE